MTGLQYQYVDVPFVGGLDLKTAKTQVPVSKLLSAVNAIFIKRGKIQTRNGSVAVTPPTLASAGGWLNAFNSELLWSGTINTGNLAQNRQFSYSGTTNTWALKGTVPAFGLSLDTILANIYDHTALDVGTANGITVYVYEENGVFNGTIVDEKTGTILASNVLIQGNGAGNARVVVHGSTICVFFLAGAQSQDGIGGNLYMSVVNSLSSAPFFGSPINISANLGVEPLNIRTYEAKVVGTALGIVYQGAAGLPDVKSVGISPTSGAVVIASQTVIPAAVSGTTVTLGMWYFAASSEALVAANGLLTDGTGQLSAIWITTLLAPVGSTFVVDNQPQGTDGSGTLFQPFGKLTAGESKIAGDVFLYYEQFLEQSYATGFAPSSTPGDGIAFTSLVPGSFGNSINIVYVFSGSASPSAVVSGTTITVTIKTAGDTNAAVESAIASSAASTFVTMSVTGPLNAITSGTYRGPYYLGGALNLPEKVSIINQATIEVSPGTSLAILTLWRQAYLAGEAFDANTVLMSNASGYSYLPLVYVSNDQPTYFVGQGTEIVAKMAPQYSGGNTQWLRCPTVVSAVSGELFLPIQTQTDGTALYDQVEVNIRGVSRSTISVGTQSTQSVLGYDFHSSGALLSMYDGVSFSEQNFNLFPEPPIVHGSPVSITRYQLGVSNENGTAAGEQTAITVPPPIEKPDGTVFGSGWQIMPGSYFTFVSMCDDTGTAASKSYYLYFTVDGVGSDPQLPGFDGSFPCQIASADTDLAICVNIATAIGGQTGIFTPTGGSAPLFSVQVCGPGASQKGAAVGACCVLLTAQLGSGGNSNPGHISSWSDNLTSSYSGVAPATGVFSPEYLATIPIGAPVNGVFGQPGYSTDGAGNHAVPDVSGLLLATVVSRNSLSFYIVPGGTEFSTTNGFLVASDNGSGGLYFPINNGGAPIQFSDYQPAAGPEIDYVTGQYAIAFFDGDTSHAWDIYAVYNYTGTGLSATASELVFPPGNRIMPGGFVIAPVENPAATGYTAIVFVFYVDGIGPPIGSLGPNVRLYWPLPFATQMVSIGSNYTSWQVAAAFTAVAQGIASADTIKVDTPINSVSVLLTWNTPGPTYLPAFNACASGVLRDTNTYGRNDAHDVGQFSNNTSIWQYVATYEWYDGKGQLHRSAPSEPAYAIVNGVGNTYQISDLQNTSITVNIGGCYPRLQINTTWLTNKQNISVVVYRTLINGSGIFYRVTPPAQLSNPYADNTHPLAPPQGPLYNQPALWMADTTYLAGQTIQGNVGSAAYLFTASVGGVSGSTEPNWDLQASIGNPIFDNTVTWFFNGTPDFVPFGDSTSDDLLRSNPTLYTDGGVLPNQSSPAPSFTVTHRNRQWVIPWETPNILWYSQTLVQGSGIAPAFSSLLTQPIPQEGGPCTALCSMDDKLVIFTQGRVYVIQGDGPDATGASSNFTPPDLISSEAGCISPYSVILTSEGVWFQSAKGIYLLDRNLNATYIGQAVEDLVTGNLVTSAVLMPDRNEVRFGLSNGTIVVYQTLFGQWTEFTGWGAKATLWQDKYAFQTAAGLVSTESASVNTDSGSPFSWSVVTANLNFGAIQGYARVAKVLFIGDDPTAVTIQAAINDNPNIVDTYQWKPANGPLYQARIWLTHQLCESLSLTFSGVAPQSLEDLGFEVGRQRGMMRLGNANTIGAGS